MANTNFYNGFLYLTTALIWGSTWLAIKFQLGTVAPEVSIAYRFALAAAILFTFSLLRRLPMRFGWRSHFFMALQGLFLFSLNYMLVYLAEGYLTSGLVAIIFSTMVIMNVIFGAIFIHNPIRMQVVIGAIVGLIGLSWIFWSEISSFDLSSEKFLGFILAFISAVFASLGNIISARNQSNDLPVIQTNAFGMAYGVVFMLTLVLLRGSELSFDASIGYVTSLLYLALFGSVIAFGSYLTLLGRIGPDRAAYITIIFPIISLLLSTLFEGLTWSIYQLVGVGLVIIGNAIVLTKFPVLKSPKQRKVKSAAHW